MKLDLEKIRIDGHTQPRAHIDYAAVDDYADAMEEGAKFPPVIVFFDGIDYWCGDGFHRVHSANQIGSKTIEAEVRKGTVQDAQWFSFSVNVTNGIRRTNEDKQRAVRLALQHPKGAKLSDRAIAAHVGVGHAAVSHWRQKLVTVQVGQSPRRTGRDGRTIDTENIGRKKRAAPAEVAPETQDAAPIEGEVGSENIGSPYIMAAISIVSACGSILVFAQARPRDIAKAISEYKPEEGLSRLKEAYVFIGKMLE